LDLATFALYRGTEDKGAQRRLAAALLSDNMALVTLLVAQLCAWPEGQRRRAVLPPIRGAFLLSRDDAVQCGRCGFLRALQLFDPSKGKIAYFAALHIRVFLQQAVGQHHQNRRPELVDERSLSREGRSSEEIGVDEAPSLEASVDLQRIARASWRFSKREREIFRAMRAAEFEERHAAKALAMTLAELRAAWGPLRRWLVAPTFAEEMAAIGRFLEDFTVPAPSARVSRATLRAAYARHVSREVSPHRFTMCASRLGLAQGWAWDGDRAVRAFAGVRLVERAPDLHVS
jgi:hypothetical protein